MSCTLKCKLTIILNFLKTLLKPVSLYTISNGDKLPPVKIPAGLKIEVSTNVELLSMLGHTSGREVIQRLSNNHLAFVAYINNQAAAFGWMARSNARIGELNHEFMLPQKNRYLWNFRTLAEYRGFGIYPALLQHIMQHEGDHVNRFWIIHAPENKSSLKGITKAGFEYVGKLYAKANGRIALETTERAKLLHELLHEMQFNPSAEAPASCWNCNSPYLKKREASCCCSETALTCTGSPEMLIAS